jgi:hypothetical protein
MNNIMSPITESSITESSITEKIKSLDDRLKENEMIANYNDSYLVNKTRGVDPLFYTQLRELYDKAKESEEEGL